MVPPVTKSLRSVVTVAKTPIVESVIPKLVADEEQVFCEATSFPLVFVGVVPFK